MPAYHYIALIEGKQQLSGVIEAPDEQGARKKLNDLGLAVISLNVVAGPVPKADKEKKNTYEFEAIDKSGKNVVGTISAENPLAAYSRLVTEYRFEVSTLISTNLKPEERHAAKQLGIESLKKEYEKKAGKKIQKTEEQQTVVKEDQQKELLEAVDMSVKLVKDFLEKYSGELKIDERNTIQSYINQLSRIKDSANLEHIRTTCGRMLDYVQKEELFLQEEAHMSENVKLKLESKEILEKLKQTGFQKDIDIIEILTALSEKPFLRPIAGFFLRLFRAHNPEIQKLRREIKIINKHTRGYLKMLVFGKSKLLRLEAWQSVKTLREQKKRLKLQIKALLEEEKKLMQAQREPSYFLDHLESVLGWLLAFYLLSYFVAYPFTIKDFGFKTIQIPDSFYFYSTELVKAVTLFLFLAYCAVKMHNFWLKQHWFSAIGNYLFATAIFLLIAINLL